MGMKVRISKIFKKSLKIFRELTWDLCKITVDNVVHYWAKELSSPAKSQNWYQNVPPN